ncbi:uncharacterized protein LOC144558917 [Carex rostrata]
MGDKVYTLVISVDLGCCRCRQAIQDYLCQLQGKHCNRIVAIVYDEKNNHVLVSGPFDPEQLKRKLLCKFPKIINGIDIREPPKEKPKEEKPKEKPPPKDENKEKWLKECLEEYEEISKCIEKCKKECEEKCRIECEKKFRCKCKRKCKCDCDCEKKKDPPKEEQPKQPPVTTPKEPPKDPPKPPMHPWPPQITMVCCPCPCPCFTPWSNNWRCCSCGVESWPGMCGPGLGSGPSHGGRPQWGKCESSQPPNIVFESSAPPCSIM